MARVLLIDDDETCLDLTGHLLKFHNYEFRGALRGNDGLRLAREWKPDVALVDLFLPDVPGIEVLAQLEKESPETVRVIFSGYATFDLAVEAMRVGACDCLTKPAFENDIVTAVERALARRQGPASSVVATTALPPVAHAAERWAQPIVRAIETTEDPRTLRELGKSVFVSVGCFRNWCRTARVSSRASLAFARALRTVYRFEHDHSTRPENLLSIVDQRTLVKFVRRCGGHGDHLPDTVEDFLERQQFIANREAIEAVRTLLKLRYAPTVTGSAMPEIRVNAADRRGAWEDQ